MSQKTRLPNSQAAFAYDKYGNVNVGGRKGRAKILSRTKQSAETQIAGAFFALIVAACVVWPAVQWLLRLS